MVRQIVINQNPTHGFFGDALESGVDKAGLGTTGIAKQTGAFINDVTTARAKEGSNFAAHSQGNLLTKSGIEYQKEHGGFMDRSYFIDITLPDSQQDRGVPTFAGYGSPVNTNDMDDVIGVHGINYNYKGMYTKKNDAVGEFLGNNKGNNQVNPNRSLLETAKNAGLLFDLGGESPHSTYDCRSNPNAMCGERQW